MSIEERVALAEAKRICRNHGFAVLDRGELKDAMEIYEEHLEHIELTLDHIFGKEEDDK